MSKLICFSLFNGKCEPFEMVAYVRGFYWNSRMNSLIYPDWRTHLEVDRVIYTRYQALFDFLVSNNNLDLNINEVTPQLCEGMLWRMKPLFTINVDHIICRDCDALTTYREAQAVQTWIESGIPFHAINDNPAHGGLMGGMVGFDTARLKSVCGWNTWEEMITAAGDLSKRGSDQHFLNRLKLPADSVFLHNLHGHKLELTLPGVSPKLWESDLCVAFIGAAGVNEMETIRFFKRHDEYSWKFREIEMRYRSELFYWVSEQDSKYYTPT